MRRILPLSFALALASCATAPQQPTVAPPAPEVTPQDSSTLVGLTAQELFGRFGAPALQIREGNSLKLQFRGPRCVMDTYLYPSGASGTLKVTHVDTRLPSGGDTDQAACVFALRNRSI
ncbi:MAG TPA: hypothetical protein VE968_04550 [Sphingomicrobium sp.]|nr:hypothetical protein [Sphingomicrobium sp.]